MAWNCPHCQSNMTQKASAIYDQGTSYSSGTVSMGGWGSNGYQTSTGRTSSTSQTNLASRAAPPPKKEGLISLVFRAGFCGGMLCMLAEVFLLDGGNPPDWYRTAWTKTNELLSQFDLQTSRLFFVVAAVLAVIAVPFGIKNSIWNFTEHPRLTEQWERKWYCHRCDRFFMEDDR